MLLITYVTYCYCNSKKDNLFIICYVFKGISYFKVAVSGPGRDLHSGVFGGTVHEPMTDLVILFSKLVTPDGKILVPGINDDVAKLTGKLLENLFYYYLFVNNSFNI